MTKEGDRTRMAIMQMMVEDPGVTFRAISKELGLNVSTVFTHVQELMADGKVGKDLCPHCRRSTWSVAEGSKREDLTMR